jgi:hypothetical protein
MGFFKNHEVQKEQRKIINSHNNLIFYKTPTFGKYYDPC